MKSPTLCVVACLSASVLLAQGLGGAARKEQERRKKNAEAGVEVRTVGETELLSATEGKGTFSSAASETSSGPEVGGESSFTGTTSAPDPGGGSTAVEGAISSNAEGHPERPRAQSRSEGSSELDRLNEKSAAWRARYRAAKQKSDALEREVADLEDKNSRIAGVAVISSKPIRDSYGRVLAYENTPRDPNIHHEAERVMERLPQARKELARAKQELSSVEDGARRAGVASGQLY